MTRSVLSLMVVSIHRWTQEVIRTPPSKFEKYNNKKRLLMVNIYGLVACIWVHGIDL